MVVIVLFMVLAQVPLSLRILWLPLLFVELAAFSLSIAFFLSALFMRFRDLNDIWEVVLQAAFYAAPNVYPLSMIPTRGRASSCACQTRSPRSSRMHATRWMTDQTETISQLFGSPWVRAIPVGIVIVLAITSVIYFRVRSLALRRGGLSGRAHDPGARPHQGLPPAPPPPHHAQGPRDQPVPQAQTIELHTP